MLGKEDDCVVLRVCFSWVFMRAQKSLHTQEIQLQPSVRLLFSCLCSSGESEGDEEEDRGVVGEREAGVQPLTCC